MPTTTTNFSLNKPLVNDAVDEDLWGGQLNTNMDLIDDRLVPTGSVISFAGTTAPNADWLLCDGAAVSRTTFAALFALVSTSFGVGDGSTTFNVPDLRGRAAIGLDNLGGSSANRITDTNADTLNNTGGGSETQSATGTISVNSVTLAQNNLPATLNFSQTATQGDTAATNFLASGNANSQDTVNVALTNSGGGTSFTPTGSFSGTASSVEQPWIALGAIIKT